MFGVIYPVTILNGKCCFFPGLTGPAKAMFKLDLEPIVTKTTTAPNGMKPDWPQVIKPCQFLK